MVSIDLQKRVQQVGISLEKRGIKKAPTMTVGVAFDVSGSTRNMFYDGTIQRAFDRLLAVSLKFDDNGELDVWTFSDGCDRLRTAVSEDEGTFISEEILNNSKIDKWGGTSYQPVLQDAIDFYIKKPLLETITSPVTGFFAKLFGFGKQVQIAGTNNTQVIEDEKFPAMILFITDGENSDHAETLRLLRSVKDESVYIQMVGVGGGSNFRHIVEYSDLFQNVGFVSLNSLNIEDEKLFDSLITQKFADWHTALVK